jgi:hypothetical protein
MALVEKLLNPIILPPEIFLATQKEIKNIKPLVNNKQYMEKYKNIWKRTNGKITSNCFFWLFFWADTAQTNNRDDIKIARDVFFNIFGVTYEQVANILHSHNINFKMDSSDGLTKEDATKIRQSLRENEENKDSKAAFEKVIKYLGIIEDGGFMYNYIELLKANFNLILTGAPGTGKTYLAKQIAMQMIFSNDSARVSLDPKDLGGEDRKLFDEQFCFVQFHPSYDYTDFVEGLRPTEPDEHGNIGFKLKNGVFKEFCKRAQKAQRQEASSDNFDEAWQKFLQILEEHSLDEHSSLKISENFSVKLTQRGSIRDMNPDCGTYTRQNIYNVYRGLKGRDSGAFDSRMKKIRDYLKEKCNLRGYVESERNQPSTNETKKSNPPYIFIIDEINRGEISKIFGELFFSVDPGYRGKKGKVQTQYANIQSDDTIFDQNEGQGWFYVPENVYIIGTMNDIDRSVESMDFAMRRRFVWKEVTAKESAENMKLPEGVKSNMNALNNVIWPVKEDGSTGTSKEGVEGLSSAYHIGGAYFCKLLGEEGYGENENGYKKLWDMHLKLLLSEYLRGIPESDSILEKLKSAYYKSKEPDKRNDETKAEGA